MNNFKLFFLIFSISSFSASVFADEEGGPVKVKVTKGTRGGWSSSGDGFVKGASESSDENLNSNEASNNLIAGGDSAGGAVGGTGGTNGGGGGSKMLKRSIASVAEVDDSEVEKIKLNAAKKCLSKLSSSYIPISTSKDEDISSIKKEITLSVNKLKTESKVVDSAHFPDCVLYANEMNDMNIKNLFFKARVPTSEQSTEPASSSVSK